MRQPQFNICACGVFFFSETGQQTVCPYCRKMRKKKRYDKFIDAHPTYQQDYGRLRYQAKRDTAAECKRIRLNRLRQLAVEAGLVQSREVAI